MAFELLEIHVLNFRFTNCNKYIVRIENILNKIHSLWNILNKVLKVFRFQLQSFIERNK